MERDREPRQSGKSHQERLQHDSLGVTLISVLLGIALSSFSIAREYLAWWQAMLVALAGVGVIIAMIKLGGRDGWLKRLGRWLTRS